MLRLLGVIEKRLDRLEKVAGTSLEEYVADPDLQDRVERNFEVAIQACLDLALHVLADFPEPVPDTYRDVFRALVHRGILEASLGQRLEAMAGFRNLLVHGYADVVPEKVHHSLSELNDIRAFVASVTSYLQRTGTLPASPPPRT
ncbi:MAG: DUF86 domain-containing protein [Bacillota bacterium]